jgi:hypothetical protein
MNGEMGDGVAWVDEGLDGLREEIDEHFTSRNQELGELRKEIEHLTRRRPSVFARWGLAPLPRFSRIGRQASTSWSLPSVPRTGLSWTDGRIADLKIQVRDASNRASDDIAEIKAQIVEFNEETSNRRFYRQTFLVCFVLAVAGLSPLIV